MEKTREPQYQNQLELRRKLGLTSLGLVTNQVWHDDPRRLCFLLARYKFAAKMLKGRSRVLEVGCGDAFGTRLVRQEVASVCAVDFDPIFVRDVQDRQDPDWQFECRVHDIVRDGPVPGGPYDAAYAIDVLEHVKPSEEERCLENISRSLTAHSVFIAGLPSLQSQAHASPASRQGHVNCKDEANLRGLLLRYFRHVFIFSMNDEVVHTGFPGMAHYLMALCCEIAI